MVSVTDTRKAETANSEATAIGGRPIFDAARLGLLWAAVRRRFGRFTLTRRILAVNMLAVALLGGGMLYLDRYERGLIATELQALGTQGGIFGAALGEGAVLEDLAEGPVLVPSLAQGMMRRLVEPTRIRARLFMAGGGLVADSRALTGPGGTIQMEQLAPPDDTVPSLLKRFADWLSSAVRARDHRPSYVEHAHEMATDYPEVLQALDGRVAEMVRSDQQTRGLILSVAVPVRRYKQVLGALLLSVDSTYLEHQVDSVRIDILRLFLTSLVFTFLLSLYLAGTIARPVRQLAQAANEVRSGNGRQIDIPDFGRRGDEIGELSVALGDMTRSLWRRMDAIEGFAADVAHEIKNPLSSLRSAVETAARIKEPEQQQRLMAIILDDVQRLDRLISDISDASRLDAEMSRLERSSLSLAGILTTLADVHQATRREGGPVLEFHRPDGMDGPDTLAVLGQESRLVQVFQNLIGNAVSFSPPDGLIRMRAFREDHDIVVSIEDDGPGIPDGKLEAIFDRFYTERPAGEKFGTHSGLGLSISKQIIEAHGGRIIAENRTDAAGHVAGARFLVRLPRAP